VTADLSSYSLVRSISFSLSLSLSLSLLSHPHQSICKSDDAMMRNQQENSFVIIFFEDLTFETPILSMKVRLFSQLPIPAPQVTLRER
jgi:hypothetical protein